MHQSVLAVIFVKVCPTQKNMPLESFERHGYVIRALDQSVVSRSTSGGFVSPLADWISKQGGVICGATYDKNFKVVHVISGGGKHSEAQNMFKVI